MGKLIVGGATARMDGAARLNRRHHKRVVREMGMEALAEVIAYQALTREFLDGPQAEAQLGHMREAFGRTDPRTFLTMIESLERLEIGERLREVQAPTLVMAGHHDQLTPLDTGPTGIGLREMARRIPNATLRVFDCGHLFLVERVGEAVEAMVEFVAS